MKGKSPGNMCYYQIGGGGCSIKYTNHKPVIF
jgi:hypothetical protein